MDAADREPRDIHRIETSLLPLKKRASNYSSGGGRISAADDPYASSSSKKKRMADDNSIIVGAETKYTTTGALEAPVPRQRRSVPAAPAASREPAPELPAPAAAPSPAELAAEGNNALSDEEKKRLSKGKWIAREQESSRRRVPLSTPQQQQPVKKLMHDGIRSFVPQQLMIHDDHQHHHANAATDFGEALERRLAELGATRPWLVHSKTLHKSDVDENQNRLLVSCKRGGSGTEDCPITWCFSPAELDRVKEKHAGLWVTALDHGGAAYALTCKFLGSNNGYRFITEWKDFLIRNGMNLSSQPHRVWERDVEVELWAFRSRRLPFQPQIDAEGKVITVETVDEDGKKVTVAQRVSDHMDPDGSLGFVLLHHENTRRRVVKTEEEDDDDWKEGPSWPPSVVARKKGKQQSGNKRGASASALPPPVALPPAPVAVAVAEQGEGLRHEPTFYAAVGLAKVRWEIREGWKEYADRRQAAKGFSNNVAKSPAYVEGEKINKDIKKPGKTQHKDKERGGK